MTKKSILGSLLPVMLAFFCMGFVDLVGAATNYVKDDFNLSDTVANTLPSIVFFWFLLFSVPTGVLMGKIGRRKTVILSLIVTAISLAIPFVNYSYISMLISFSLLGIGNTLMQVAINPLLSSIVKGDKLASSLTFGQFIKAIASFVAPIIMARTALAYDNWKILFPIFTIISVIAIVWLGFTSIEEEKQEGKSASFAECFSLLGNKFIFLCFLGIMCHVGIDVGVNVTAPKLLMERVGVSLEDATYATSVYFLFRTIGAFSGAFILSFFSPKKFFTIGVICMVAAMVGFFIFDTKTALYVAVALVGFGNSNIFPIIFSQAMYALPNKKNEVSGLMIMGLFGGTIFPFFMGLATDAVKSQTGALIVLSIGVVYLILMTLNLKGKTT
ncbi:MFS transporter [Capnocytophaga cynodegmi]|uniref:MFS transporter n=1 Tax=Capnocytophaga cynodegmi TaxID=28189 RepID=UPI0020881A76|nr:MFS transporter [Capnocytophaga cynodegmi]GJQ07056.1 MFS transporter [Capnocytophaga cynodegmi]